jgi:hypothetical protein
VGFELPGHSGEDRVGLAPTSRFCIAAASVAATRPPADMLTAELIADLYDGDCLVTTHPVTGTPLITFIHAAAAEPSIRHDLLLFVRGGSEHRATPAAAAAS